MPERLAKEVSEWWRYMGVKQAGGYISALIGIVLTIVTAVVTGPPQLLIALIAVAAQGAAAFWFSNNGRVHPTHAKSALGRLLQLARRVDAAEKAAQADFDDRNKTLDERHTELGIIGAELSYIGDGIYAAAADWLAFNEPLEEMISDDQRRAVMLLAKNAREVAESQGPSSVDEIDLVPELDEGDK